MWTRSELKARAKAVLSTNYWKLVLVAVIANVIAGVSNSVELEYKTDGSGLSVGVLGVVEESILAMAPILVIAALIVAAVSIAVSIKPGAVMMFLLLFSVCSA